LLLRMVERVAPAACRPKNTRRGRPAQEDSRLPPGKDSELPLGGKKKWEPLSTSLNRGPSTEEFFFLRRGGGFTFLTKGSVPAPGLKLQRDSGTLSIPNNPSGRSW